MILLVEIQIYKIPLAEFKFFGKSDLIGWLIQACRPPTYANKYFGDRPQALLLNELCPPSHKILGFH